MSIGTNDLILKFGTQDDITDGATQAISNDAYSVDEISWTNDDDAPMISIVFQCQYPSGTLASRPFLAVYCRLLDVDSTDDEAVPDSGHVGHYLGNLDIDSGLGATTDTWSAGGPFALPAPLASGQSYGFTFHNNTNVTISAGWTLRATPVTIGPHA